MSIDISLRAHLISEQLAVAEVPVVRNTKAHRDVVSKRLSAETVKHRNPAISVLENISSETETFRIACCCTFNARRVLLRISASSDDAVQ